MVTTGICREVRETRLIVLLLWKVDMLLLISRGDYVYV
jgi:hypothetical protein